MRESRTLEFKENVESNTFLKTISAFANYGEGKIIFGIEDDGNIKGILEPQTACLRLENKINDSITPVPEYSLEIKEDSTIVLTVYEGRYKPYLYRRKAYKRNDSATIEVERLEYNRLILEGSNQSFEELPNVNQELAFKILEKEMVQILGIHELNIDILKTLGMYSERDGYNHAAALFADQNSFKGIDMIRFGDSIDEIMDRTTLEEISVIEQFKNAVEMFRKYYEYEKIEGTSRISIEKIPEKAFREAIANALVHRQWDVNAFIRVSMYSDRIEITSPGGLPAGISEEEYLNGQISLLRNPILGNVFFRLKYIEKIGTGILRINHAYEHALMKPSYQIYDNSISVRLPIILAENKLTTEEQAVVEVLKKDFGLSRKEIEWKTGYRKDKVIRILNVLLEKNIIFFDVHIAKRIVRPFWDCGYPLFLLTFLLSCAILSVLIRIVHLI